MNDDSIPTPRMGRPPKPKAMIRKEFIKVYVTADQKSAFTSKATEAGMSGSDFAHRIIGPAVWDESTTPESGDIERNQLLTRASTGLAEYLAALLESQ